MRQSLLEVIGAQALAAFDDQQSVESGLPPTACTSESFSALEDTKLFRNAWTFVGFAHEIAEPGDAMPISVAGQPLLLVRNQKGAINVFHNVCRHRCVKLVECPGNVGRVLRGPYHSWT